MRAFVHRFLGWSAGAVFSGLLAAVTLGGENVRLKIADAASAIYADGAARTAVAIVLLLWFVGWWITKPGVWDWLKSFRRQPPLLYLTPVPGKSPDAGKMYVIKWDPEDLHTSFNGDGPYSSWPPPPADETSLCFNLFNAGPEDARHIEISFCLDADLQTLVAESKVFGDCLNKFEDEYLWLETPDTKRGASRPVLKQIDLLPIPVLKAENHVQIDAPRAFCEAYSILALAKAKLHHEATFTPDAWNNMDHLRLIQQSQQLLVGVFVRAKYVAGDKRRSQVFEIKGWLSGGGVATATKAADDGSYRTVEGSVQALVYGVCAEGA